MSRPKSFILGVIIALFAYSCDEEIFGPRNFEGFWDVTENSETFGELSFRVWIEYHQDDENRLIIHDFAFLEEADVIADIAGHTLTIRTQSVTGRGGTFRISGSGTASSNMRRIDWNYRVDNEEYTAVFVKR